jgi:hypothetical protein
VLARWARRWIDVGAVVCLACSGCETVVELPEARTPPAEATECTAANPLGGFTVYDPDLNECVALAQRASPSGDIRCWITFDVSGAAIDVRCPGRATREARVCLATRLRETVVVPYTDCAGNQIQHRTDVGIAWSGEGSTAISLPRYTSFGLAVE